ncbi:MAG: hypothetical protein ACXWE4_02290 [Methylobacter sp.]
MIQTVQDIIKQSFSVDNSDSKHFIVAYLTNTSIVVKKGYTKYFGFTSLAVLTTVTTQAQQIIMEDLSIKSTSFK